MNVNYLAPINPGGYGTAGTNILKGLLARGVEVALWPIGPLRYGDSDSRAVRIGLFNARTFDPDAPSLRVWHPYAMGTHVGKNLHCGFPIFELTRLSHDERHHLGTLDVVFTATRWAEGVLRENGLAEDKIAVARLGVDRAIFHEAVTPVRSAPHETTFLNIGTWGVRKGHDLLLKAFNLASRSATRSSCACSRTTRSRPPRTAAGSGSSANRPSV